MRCPTPTTALLIGLMWTLGSVSTTAGNTSGNGTEPATPGGELAGTTPTPSGQRHTQVLTPSGSSSNYVTSTKPPTERVFNMSSTDLAEPVVTTSIRDGESHASTVPQQSQTNAGVDDTTTPVFQTTIGVGQKTTIAESDQQSLTTTPAPKAAPLVTTAGTTDVVTTPDLDIVTTSGADLYPCGKVSYRQKVNTSCNPCFATRAFGCPQTARFVREAPCYGHNFCVFECELMLEYPQCCVGRWGPDCRLCPGAVTSGDAAGGVLNTTNVCSQRGACAEGLEGNGTCTCLPAYTGYACERCAASDVYGAECDHTCMCGNHGDCDAGVTGTGRCDCHLGYQGERCDQLAQCNNSYCGDNAQCHADLGQRCVCLHGYRGDGQTCTLVDMCAEGTDGCDGDARCEMTGPANYSCTCKVGYQGDGLVCDPIDPCQDLDDPVCPANSSTCEYAGPGKYACKCLPGFANFTDGSGCAVVNLCEPRFKNCHENANCTMLSPNRYRCACHAGYVGNGKVCHGNILQSLLRMNAERPLRNQLNKAIRLFQYGLGEALQHVRSFTVFVPTDAGFSGVDLPAVMGDWAAASQTVKNHILPVARTLHQLVNGTIFYTLEGYPAEITVIARRSQIKYRLSRTSTRAKIVRGNFPASNGIIHVINKLVDKPPVIGYKKRQTLLQQVQYDGRYNRLEGLVATAGLTRLLNSTTRNLTLFAPSNKLWDSLGDGVLEFLQSPEGKPKLVTLLKNHIVDNLYFSWDMMMETRVKTLSNNIVEVMVSPTGQLLLNGNRTSVIQSDIPAANGLYHHITGVLVPESIQPILNRRCDVNKTVVVAGRCGLCSAVPQCLGVSDVVLDDSYQRCTFTHHPPGGRNVTIAGCRPQCNRTVVEARCCSNFYGPNCDPCPGGPQTPCGGRGECNQGITGNGSCTCLPEYTGKLCNQCTDPKKYGNNCTEDCKCVFGECRNYADSTRHGFCKPGTCQEGYFGVMCSLNRQKCGTLRHTHCHAHAYCSLSNSTQLLQSLLPGTEPGQVPYGHYSSLHFKLLQLRTMRRCVCMDGYSGDGVDACTPIDPCTQPTRGDCHQEATCSYLSPGASTCTCNRGWVGDGAYCYPSTPCADANASHCHPDAVCQRTAPGESHCVCLYNYHGNGTHCVPNNMCEFNNGGCSGLATCTALGPGNRTCTCGAGYGGDGISCIGSLWHELQLILTLNNFKRLLDANSSLTAMLSNVTAQYTIFAPSNVAVLDATLAGSSCVSPTVGVQYYILPHRYTLQQLKMLSHSATGNVFLPTLAQDSTGKVRELKVTFTSELTVNKAHIVTGGYAALNGLIHIIDDCLIPKAPVVNLSHLLAANPRYSLFTAALTQTNLTAQIEALNAFTLFILDNVHWKVKLNGTDLKKYLSYYIIQKRIYMDTLPSFTQEPTVLGSGPSSLLNITVRSGKVYINEFIIHDERLQTMSGTVYHLTHPLTPNLQRCDVADHIGGYRRECCPGYYGYDCLPCPGGATSPCNTHGTCSAGIEGSGVCRCKEGYTGEACSSCDKSYIKKGSQCEVDPCTFCHAHADCIHRGNTTHCRCAESYRGDGTNCTHVCGIRNGGCDPNALCVSSQATSHRVTCTCPPEFYGNGLNCTRIVSLVESLRTLGVTRDFYSLLSTGDGGDDSPEHMLKAAVNYTLIVPENWAGNTSVNETGVDAKRHIVGEYFELVPSLFDGNYSYITLSGDALSMDYTQDERTYTINGSIVIHRNIPATNGILHIIDGPLRPPPITAPVTSEHTFGTMAVVIGVLAVVLVLMIVVVALLLWKCRRHCCHQPGRGQAGGGFKFLILDDKDEHCKDAGIIDAASTYHNPLYDTLESSGLTEESTW